MDGSPIPWRCGAGCGPSWLGGCGRRGGAAGSAAALWGWRPCFGATAAPDASAEADLLREQCTALRVCRRDEWMGGAQIPARAVVERRKAVGCREVAAEHLAAPPAFEADHEIPCIRSVDGDCGFGRRRRLQGLPEAGEGSVDDCDKVWEIACGDLVVRDVAANNLGNETGIDRLRFSHRFPRPMFVAEYFRDSIT